jgi:GSH-dependent disulfide-bond oxidoreductase
LPAITAPDTVRLSRNRETRSMIDFYVLTSPNVQKIFIMLEELAAPYRTIPVDVWKGEQFKPEFTALNPNAKIPVIVDHDGPGGKPYTVFESGAILMYLANKFGRFLPADTARRYEAIQWLMIQLTGVGPTFGQVVYFTRFAPPGNDYAKSRYRSEMLRLYELLENRLGQSPYLGGAEYSIADIATFPWTRNHDMFGVKWSERPNLARWFDAVAARPAVKKALAIVDAITSNRDTASDEDKDRFFARGRYARA